jgi:hypothetical protein
MLSSSDIGLFCVSSCAAVRQYYMEGWYPSGRAVAEHARIPSAALLKASIISSAIGIGGRVQTKKKADSKYQDYEVLQAPSIFQGYGRMQLNNVLTFNDSMTSTYESHALWIRDEWNKDALSTYDNRAFCFRVPSFQPSSDSSVNGDHQSFAFRATLVWMDRPGVASASWLLVNNLDLFIIKHGMSVSIDMINSTCMPLMYNVQSDAEGGILMGNGHSFTDITGSHLVSFNMPSLL